jgi:hypothetical protein
MTSVKGCLRSGFRILLWMLLLAVVSVVTLFTLGYFKASKPVSYLPDLPSGYNLYDSSAITGTELRNPWYILSVSATGIVTVKSARGEKVISSLSYYSSYQGSGDKWGLENKLVRQASDSTISISGDGQEGVKVSILLTVPKFRQVLDVKISTLYNKSTIVERESIVAGFDVPVSEIYMKNRQLQSGSFDAEYWLQRQGVRFGEGEQSALIYHTPFVSSLQLNTKNRLLFINLEYSPDHPYFKIPYQKDGGGQWIDISEAKYNQGDERNNSFSLSIGAKPSATPRIMLVPNGYLAGYVFTEHADGGNIRTHRAAYFGSEEITKIADATGGFAGHKIPVTKSVFYSDLEQSADPANKNNADQPQFLDFMDQLSATGNYDLCLHGSNFDRDVLEESIRFMKERYGTISWIDHGMFSGQGNRQSFVADGMDPDSRYYVADLWKKYNTEYFWNASVEEFRKSSLREEVLKFKLYDASHDLWKRYFSPGELKQIRFTKALKELFLRFFEKGELNSLLPYRGNEFPTPLYWQNITETRNFYSWTTDYVKVFSHSEKGLTMEEKMVDRLISNWGLFINHGYFVRNIAEDGVLINSEGKLKTNPFFDKTLDYMANKRDSGDLYITTIRDLLNYWILADNVSFDYSADGLIYVTNLNDKPINGFSLVVQAENVKVNDEIPKLRKAGKETIFWFDIPAGKGVKLQID